ncbi:MAG TPA: ribosomal L7Ae/L30e/S12e/Gadd45 family protein [Longimicrobiales bacterium]|nr:ribosomal L7Ae/L30e/S12e/Gadd45 family protein [Longimicrobiales bacterium]
MTPAEQALKLLGLAARAGTVLPGTERVREAARSGRLTFAVLAADASENSRGKLAPLLAARRIPFVIRFDRVQLGAAVGRAPLGAVGLIDSSLGRRLQSLLAAEPSA